MIGALLWCAMQLPRELPLDDEARYYAVDYLTPPEGALLEVGGMGFLPDGRLAVSTRRGEVWLVENALADDPGEARFRLFADGLFEGLGLAVVEGELYVLQRGELSRLRDVDGDGRCDAIDTVCDEWGLSGNYHEFAFGLPTDREGNFYVGLNVGFLDPKWWHGKSLAPWRGWVLKIAPEGRATPFACGFRSPCGLATNAAGELFVTDNQGDWLPACPIHHVREGRFYGHPASLAWTDAYRASRAEPSDTVPPARERTDAAIWLPYGWSRSAGNLVFDDTQGRFGPFADQMFVAELTNGMVLRAQLDEVGGEYQGACFLFRRRVGSAARVLFAPDGTLLVGMTNRGWGGLPPSSGIARVRPTGETPFEMRAVHLVPAGFEIELTQPLAKDLRLDRSQVSLSSYDYDWWWEYGSPERHTQELAVLAVGVSPDRTRVTVRADGLARGTCVRGVLSGLTSEAGAPLLHDEFVYTLRRLSSSERAGELVAKLVPPPPARESGEEGWLRLCWGDAFDLWQSKGWTLCDVELDPRDPKRLRTSEGFGALVNAGDGAPTDFVSEPFFGDAAIHVEFLLPEGGRSGVSVQGRYEVVLADGAGLDACGALAPGERFAGRAPDRRAFEGAGQWHDLDLKFEAPRFDARGKKLRDARFVRVLVDDVLMHENVELEGRSASGYAKEVALGPLRLLGDRGTAAFRNVRVKPLAAEDEADAESDAAGWTPLVAEDDEELRGWSASGGAAWSLDDEGALVGSGPRGELVSARSDYRDFELRAKVKVSDGGAAALFFRAHRGEQGLEGYQALVDSSFAEREKTASLVGIAPVTAQLVPPDTWFDYRILCLDEAEGTRVTIRVNGVVITDALDRERRFQRGAIALAQHHQGSVLEVKELAVRELPRK